MFNLNFNHSFNQTPIFSNQPQLKILFIKQLFSNHNSYRNTTLTPEYERGRLILKAHEASYHGCKSPSLVVLEAMRQGLSGEIVHDDGGAVMRL